MVVPSEAAPNYYIVSAINMVCNSATDASFLPYLLTLSLSLCGACREFQIGVDIQRGRGRYRSTRIVTFVAHYQLENRTHYKLAFLQRHQLKEEVSA